VKITSEELKVAAVDARLSFAPAQAEALRHNMQQFLEEVQAIQEGHKNIGTLPLFFPLETRNVYREDRVENSLPREKALANGPDTDTACFHVPRIVEG
jgi:aspartyl-tRNA(Asn)/glutamyl-tRNA(Gln) amidotransferase subunit C